MSVVTVRETNDSATFQSFFLTEFPRLVAMLTVWSNSVATAEDLAQDALIRAEADWDQVSTLDSPGAWVRRVALNRSLNERRRLRRQCHALSRIDSAPTDHAEDSIDAELWTAVRKLGDKQRAAIVLRYVDDLALADIAAVLGCSVGTVKTHLQRGRRRLARTLGQELQR